MSMLVRKGATDILTHYGPWRHGNRPEMAHENGQRAHGFPLPINTDAVFEILTRGPGDEDQAGGAHAAGQPHRLADHQGVDTGPE